MYIRILYLNLLFCSLHDIPKSTQNIRNSKVYSLLLKLLIKIMSFSEITFTFLLKYFANFFALRHVAFEIA